MNRILVFITMVFLAQSCQLFEGGNEVPMYLNIDTVNFETASNQGANTHKIKNVWVAVDGVVIGAYEIPVVVPIISDNEQITVRLFPGVLNNGVSANPIIYPLYSIDEHILEFEENKVVDIEFNVEYGTNTKFAFIEEFENGSAITLDLDGNSNSNIQRTTEESASGEYSGKIKLDTTNFVLEVASDVIIDPETNGLGVSYLELDYKGDLELQIGLQGIISSNTFKEYKLVLNPTDEWTKIYVEFNDIINLQPVEGYKILVGAILSSDVTESTAYIDNIKLVHF